MIKNILKLIDEAIENKEQTLDAYKRLYNNLQEENEQLKKEIAELRQKKDW